MLTEEQELEKIKQNSPYALPDNPSQSGWSSAQIKEKFYAGLLVIYDLLKDIRSNFNDDLGELSELVDTINSKVTSILDGTSELPCKYDDEHNEIKITYAKIANIENGVIGALKYIKANGTTANIEEIAKGLADLKDDFEVFVEDNSPPEYAKEAGFATKDSEGNIIKDHYAKDTSLNQTNEEVEKIKNGTTIVQKAYKDQNGKLINTFYTKVEDIVNNLTSTITNKPLSAYQGKLLKDSIDSLNLLLESDDTSLDTLQEVVTYIKNNSSLISGITTSKVNVSDIIDNISSAVTNKPLSANMGKWLKEYIDDCVEEIGVIPTISTNIEDDATNTTKTACPKAVKDYVDLVLGDVASLLEEV